MSHFLNGFADEMEKCSALGGWGKATILGGLAGGALGAGHVKLKGGSNLGALQVGIAGAGLGMGGVGLARSIKQLIKANKDLDKTKSYWGGRVDSAKKGVTRAKKDLEKAKSETPGILKKQRAQHKKNMSMVREMENEFRKKFGTLP